MTDSARNSSDRPDRDQRCADRFEQVRRWAEYLQREGPDVWGPQLNRLVDAQLDAAREAAVDGEEQRRMEAIAERLQQRD